MFVQIGSEDRDWCMLLGIGECSYRCVVKIGIGGC